MDKRISPLPWTQLMGGVVDIYDNKGEWIAQTVETDSGNDAHNADFIVKAVNNHAELVKRLTWAVRFIETYASKAAGPATPELNKCRAALAAAEAA